MEKYKPSKHGTQTSHKRRLTTRAIKT